MDEFFDAYNRTKNLHHAYIVEGEREAIREKLLKFIQKTLKHEIHGNPDFSHEHYESFSIDDARNLRERQSTKALGGLRKVFVLETLGMTVEAQNSLLKIFEEPTPGTHFFILVPSADVFLPTLRSRVIIVTDEGKKKQSEDAKNFLSMSSKERLELVGEIAEEKDKARAITLVEDLIRFFHTQNIPEQNFLMKELLKTRSYISDRSPSLKVLLEHIALITPAQ